MDAREDNKVRLDKWLWAARFYKTRSLASEAINGGHVHVNGERARPSRLLNIGDELQIRKGPFTYRLTVRGLSGRRGPAPAAQQLYEEDEESRQQRAEVAERRRLQAEAGVPPQRPDKRSRRKIIRFLRRGR